MICRFKKYNLHFKTPGGTSRGVLYNKDTYILMLADKENVAYGECNLFKKLSYDDRKGYEEKLKEVCSRLPEERDHLLSELEDWPSIRFGMETALRDWENGCRQIIFPEVMNRKDFTVPINGLIWMGPKEAMKAQIISKLKAGYVSIKLKIGAIDFNSELELLKFIREQFSGKEVEIRLDANGAFRFDEAKEKIKRLAEFDIHYLEQPIKAGQWEAMADLAENSPVKIALDEELIGILKTEARENLINTISPQILILKPALTGGFAACNEWKKLVESNGGDWVITSALESNIGLNAITQYAALGKVKIAQGLGTGQLFSNNFPSPYSADSSGIHYHNDRKWDFSLLK